MIHDIGTFKPDMVPSQQLRQAMGTDAVNASTRPKPVEPDEPGAVSEGEPLESVVSDLNKLVQNLQRELQFSIDQKSGDVVIKVVDQETEEVVRQIPSAELMALRRRLEEASGVIFQDSA